MRRKESKDEIPIQDSIGRMQNLRKIRIYGRRNIKMYEKIMTAITGLGWLAVLIGAAAVPEDAVKGIIVAAVGIMMMGIGGRNIEKI